MKIFNRLTLVLSMFLVVAFLTAGTVAATELPADFIYNQITGNTLTYHFIDTSTGNPVAWHWNFGDSYTATVQNPTHKFSTPGRYDVTLTVTVGSGGNMTDTSITKQVDVGIAYE